MVLIQKNTGGLGLDAQKTMDALLPFVVVTDGTVNFSKECTFPAVSMYGSTVSAAKGQNFVYDVTALDSFLDSLDSRNLLPKVLDAASGTVNKLSGSWAEVP